MVTRSLAVDDPKGAARTASAPAPHRAYRLDVLGTDAADLVRFAGGWMFDRASAGWRVNPWLLDADDLRPPQVPGAGPPTRPRARRTADEYTAGLAVSASLAESDADVRERCAAC